MFKASVASLALLTLLLVGNAPGLEMTVSPHVLVVKSPGTVVTVHTDVAYARVEGAQLSVNGTPLRVSTFSDDCGDLVVQCKRADVVAAVADAATADFTLTVETDDGAVASAFESVRVKR